MRGRGMPEVATVEGIGAHAGRTVTLRGWLAGRRSSGKLHFLQVREGTGTLFPVQYFDETAYLTQSGQLYAEAGAMAFGKVYCFGPTFRAEKSKTRRHLTEFWMVEPEMAFAGLDEDMDLAEDFLVHVVGAVRERRQPELRALGRDLAPLARVEKPFPRITYAEALDILRKKGFPLEWGADLGGDEETALSQ